VYEIREMLRFWVRDEGLRLIERLAVLDCKTVRSYVTAAVCSGALGPRRRRGPASALALIVGVVGVHQGLARRYQACGHESACEGAAALR